MSWVVSLPAWGERCIGHALNRGLPSLFYALNLAGIGRGACCFVIQTDRPEQFEQKLADETVTLLPTPKRANKYEALAASNRQAIEIAKPGDVVLTFNADFVCSREYFVAIGARIAQGKKLLLAAGIRTAYDDEEPPVDAPARALLEWGWLHRHHWTEDCVWDRGRTVMPSHLFFERGCDDVVLHAFHQQPIAFVKLDGMRFENTADDTLQDCYPRQQVHVVTDADELAYIELSPPGALFASDGPLTAERVIAWANQPMKGTRGGKRVTPSHRWLFEHRIVIMGDGTQGQVEREACAQIRDRA